MRKADHSPVISKMALNSREKAFKKWECIGNKCVILNFTPDQNDLQRWTLFAVNAFSFLHQRGVKTSRSLVNEFTGVDVSLDEAAGGV